MKSGCKFIALWLGAGTLAIAAAESLPLMPVTVGAAEFQVELAQTPDQRERGLMFRKILPKGRGMLFEQPAGPAVFWMKNTSIPLDLLYFDSGGKLLQIQANVPPCTTPACPVYPSESATIRYILEINAGEAAKQGIELGHRLYLKK
ncbi:MAG: DUF192 domain-containing protein [Candidatus Competibacteraceae bacterium]|nr:DUF192 domain-containing protein [Candidatus Competibacteraceae bacterium]